MKLIPIIIFFALAQISYGQTFYNDTTLTGTFNGLGKVLRIEGKISGNVTITNAIIEASPFKQIFDTTVIIGSGVQVERFSAMWYGAKPSLLDNSRQLQYAINASINKNWWLYIPSGIYKTKDSLIVKSGEYGAYQQSKIKIYGESSMWGDGGSVIKYSGDFCAIGLQLNKGTVIKNLILSGNWKSPATTGIDYYSTLLENYNNESVSGGNGNGLWVDPFGDWNQRSGSTGLLFQEMQIGNFMTNVKISNSISQNAEILIFENIQIKDGKYGFLTNQPQEKGNVFRGIYSWGKLHTLFTINSGNYYIDGANIAGSNIRVFNINSSGWFPSHIQNVYAENIGSVGNIYTNVPASISNSIFDFAHKNFAGNQVLVSSGEKVKFNNCLFRYYGNSDVMNMATSSAFENCGFSGPLTGVSNSTFIRYQNGSTITSGNIQVTVNDTIQPTSIQLKLRRSPRN